MKSTPTLEAVRKKVPRRLLGRAVCWPPMRRGTTTCGRSLARSALLNFAMVGDLGIEGVVDGIVSVTSRPRGKKAIDR